MIMKIVAVSPYTTETHSFLSRLNVRWLNNISSKRSLEVDVIIHFSEALGRVLRKVLLLGRDLTCRMPLFVTSQLFNLWFVNTPQHALYVALVLAVDNCQQGYVISLIYSPLRILHLRNIQILGTHWSWRKVTFRNLKMEMRRISFWYRFPLELLWKEDLEFNPNAFRVQIWEAFQFEIIERIPT